ncbi:hypothetical protein [[Mycobacterium] zoologicum]|uniref:hypothetical protein n=1 Tax=[Mycobacterium] zoologicum TaxID=2872311 RepID=UPI001CDA6E44|nr:hypothetical protein [Mycolicibacter sp. MYC101]MEB3064365.1 hypothetical protein [Mycolicibacter sp. MYC101]
MSIAERLGALMFRAMDKMRDRAVFDIGAPTGKVKRIRNSAVAGISIAYVEITPAGR